MLRSINSVIIRQPCSGRKACVMVGNAWNVCVTVLFKDSLILVSHNDSAHLTLWPIAHSLPTQTPRFELSFTRPCTTASFTSQLRLFSSLYLLYACLLLPYLSLFSILSTLPFSLSPIFAAFRWCKVKKTKIDKIENYLWGNSNIHLVSLGNGHFLHFSNTVFYSRKPKATGNVWILLKSKKIAGQEEACLCPDL